MPWLPPWMSFGRELRAGCGFGLAGAVTAFLTGWFPYGAISGSISISGTQRAGYRRSRGAGDDDAAVGQNGGDAHGPPCLVGGFVDCLSFVVTSRRLYGAARAGL